MAGMAQGSSPSPELLCAGGCSESLIQHRAPASAPQIKRSIFMALGKSHKRSAEILLLHYEKHFVWLLCPAGSAAHVVRSCLTHPVMNCSAASAGICSQIFGLSMMSALLSPLSRAVLWHQCDSRAEHFSSTQRCTALTSAFSPRNSYFLTTP